MQKSWTDERIEKLKRLNAEGFSFSEIAAHVSMLPPFNRVTRSAAIGKAHRLGICRGTPPVIRRSSRPHRYGPRHHKPKERHMTREAKALARLPKEPLPDMPEIYIPPEDRKIVETLDDRDCRWPIGDPQHADFHFCGKNKVPGLPYCEFHARRAFQPPPARRPRVIEPEKQEEFA